MAKPLKNIIEVSVTINGGIRNATTAAPFNNPKSAPRNSMASAPAGADHRLPPSQPLLEFIIMAPLTLVRAMIEVADKSMPPVIRTSICPMAAMVNGSKVASRFARFSVEVKPGVKGASAAK